MKFREFDVLIQILGTFGKALLTIIFFWMGGGRGRLAICCFNNSTSLPQARTSS